MSNMDRITVAQGDISLTFTTGSLGEAALLLNACTAQTLISWGLDPARQDGLQRLAFPEEPKKLARKMISLFANRYLRSGPFEAVALVDETGTATGCRILPGPGYDDLDAAACQVMTKARYLPAIDAEGRPVASYWKTRVAYNVLDTERLQLSMQAGQP
jgi:TonB family protein